MSMRVPTTERGYTWLLQILTAMPTLLLILLGKHILNRTNKKKEIRKRLEAESGQGDDVDFKSVTKDHASMNNFVR